MKSLYALHVKSIDALAAAAWYVNHLSAEIIEVRRKANGDILVRTTLDGIPLNFTQHDNSPSLPRAPIGVHIGLEHFGVVVKDLGRVMAHFEAAGVEVLEPISESPGIKYAFVRGPDGIRQELIELRMPNSADAADAEFDRD